MQQSTETRSLVPCTRAQTYTRVVPAIDLNADVGEECGDDAALLAVVTTANVAAGAHAGGGDVLSRTVASAARRSVAVGAHPSYVDRDGFGRVSRLTDHDADSLQAMVRDQILIVAAACVDHGMSLTHVKAHGALYHDLVASRAAEVAFVRAVVDASTELGSAIAVLGPPAESILRSVVDAGLRYHVEAFADRRYRADGTLVPRTEPGAVLHDPFEVTDQAVSLARDCRVRAENGSWIPLQASSLCVHGDTPAAVSLATAVRLALEAEGITLQHPARS